jgi:SAM-dependent methyltransferase
MPDHREASRQEKDAAQINLSFYEALWLQARLSSPEKFNTWPLIASLLPVSPARLEVGPGLRPRLPIAGTHFIDISARVVDQLNSWGALARTGEVGALPYEDGTFDLVCAFDVIEHVQDDQRALAELSRVMKDGAVLIVSVPIHAEYWSDFDQLVGHVRRYDPAGLAGFLARNDLVLEQSAVFGMQPRNPRLLNLAVWFLTHRRSLALAWYNWILLPLGILFQRRLKFQQGLLDTDGVDEIVLICRRKRAVV